MAKQLSPSQVNKKNSDTVKALVQLMKDIDQKYSIKVGIIGSKAHEKHPDSDLTNAELGAIHEFGCTINVTEKMRKFLHYIGIHLKPETTTVVIPTRSFLRMPLLNGMFNDYLLSVIKQEGLALIEAGALGKDVEGKTLVREWNIEQAQKAIEKEGNFMERIANIIAAEALTQVQSAFENSGFGKWAPISEITKKSRKNDPTSPPLKDSGELFKSITAQVERTK